MSTSTFGIVYEPESLNSYLGVKGSGPVEVVDRVVERAHPVVVVEHRAFDVEVLPERAAADARGRRVHERSQRLPSVGIPLLPDELQCLVVALGLDAVERRHVLNLVRGVVADPGDVVAVDDAVPVVVLLHDAVEHHVLARERRERDPLVLPFLARLPVDGDVGEDVARVLVDVRAADREVVRDLPLDVERDLVGVLVLHVVGHVQRPRRVELA